MKGILLISHGPLAEGMLKTAEIFFGENIPQMKAVVLNTQDDPEDFRTRLQEAVKEVDTGEGVLVFADLLGGTPCNQSAFVLNEQVTVLTGMNLATSMSYCVIPFLPGDAVKILLAAFLALRLRKPLAAQGFEL